MDVRTELNEASVKPFHWRLVFLVFIAILFDGYDTVIPAYVIHFVAEPWGLTTVQSGLLVSSGLMGFLVGSLFHGVLADRMGRRPVLIAGLLITGIFTLLTALLANSFESFITLRILTGLGLGIIMPLGTIYVNEFAPGKVRNRLAVLAAMGFPLGGVAASLIGLTLTPSFGWQILFWIGSGALIVGAVYIAVFPESVEFLVANGRQREAARLLARIRPERADVYARATLVAAARTGSGKDWLIPLKATFLRRSLALWGASFFLLLGIYALTGWLPTLMIERGEGFTLGFAFGAIFPGVSAIGGLVGAYVADGRVGTRRGLMLWCAFGAVSALVLALINTRVTNIIAVAGAGFFIIGGQFILNNLCAAIYPMQARGTAQGYMLGIGRAGGILGPLAAGWVLGVAGGTEAVFVMVTIAAVLAGLCAIFTAGAAVLSQGGPGVTRPSEQTSI
ncbi:MFS transporter [Sinosporangium album]|uniref:MFS transporter n=1 Tax=Sinosporangium album TaxID=504805 RepID=UPI0015A16AEA|nr:MFS transporter [Sinosporangium album]